MCLPFAFVFQFVEDIHGSGSVIFQCLLFGMAIGGACLPSSIVE